MKKIPMNDTSRIGKKILSGALEDFSQIIASGRWLLGEYGDRFAHIFSSYIGTDYCIPLANGTDALELALKSVSDGDKSEIITVANAGGYTTTACYLSGLTPVYIDINEVDMLMNANDLHAVLNENTLAVVITHLYGRAVDVLKVRNCLDSLGYQNVAIIEDCAQAHGAMINGKKVGAIGDLATFSFYPTKNLGAVGDAGAITTNNVELFDKVKALAQYGWSSKYNINLKFGKNSRMDEIQAAILCILLPELDNWNNRRRDIYNQYMLSNENLGFYSQLDESNVVHLAVIRTKNRDAFIKYMNAQNVMVDIHYPVLDQDQAAWKSKRETNLDISRSITNEIVSLPCFPTMSDEEVTHICSALNGWNNE